jgi:hypothetical protein
MQFNLVSLAYHKKAKDASPFLTKTCTIMRVFIQKCIISCYVRQNKAGGDGKWKKIKANPKKKSPCLHWSRKAKGCALRVG